MPHITDLYHWFLANRRHLVRPTRFPFGSLTPGRPLDCHWIELRQILRDRGTPALRRIGITTTRCSRPSCILDRGITLVRAPLLGPGTTLQVRPPNKIIRSISFHPSSFPISFPILIRFCQERRHVSFFTVRKETRCVMNVRRQPR